MGREKVGQNWMAGALGGALARLVTAPLERVKLLQQVAAVHPVSSTLPGRARILAYVRHVTRTEGILALWKGNLVNMLRVAPSAGARYAAFEAYSSAFASVPNPWQDSPWERFWRTSIPAGLASLTASAVAYPLDFLRVRWSVEPKNPGQSLASTTSQIWRAEGRMAAFFRGLSPALLGVLPFQVIHFTTYEILRERLQLPEMVSFLKPAAAGALAGCTALVATLPLDLVAKRRTLLPAHQQPSLVRSLFWIARSEGLSALFLGSLASVMKVSVAHAIYWSVVESFK